MKAGQRIKVASQGDDSIAMWRPAILLEIDRTGADPICEVQFGEPDKVGYSVEKVPLRCVRAFMPLKVDENGECNFINEMVERDIPKIMVTLANALEKLIPNTSFSLQDGIISAYNGALTMEPVVIEKRTLGAFIEHPGWSVTVWRQHPATRNQPEDVSDSVVGEYLHYGQAVQKFIETLFLMQSEDYWDNQADLAMVEQWEQTHDDIY